MARANDAERSLKLADGSEAVSFHLGPDSYPIMKTQTKCNRGKDFFRDVYSFGSLLWMLVDGSGVSAPSMLFGTSTNGARYPGPPTDYLPESILYSAMEICWRCGKEASHAKAALERVATILSDEIIQLN